MGRKVYVIELSTIKENLSSILGGGEGVGGYFGDTIIADESFALTFCLKAALRIRTVLQNLAGTQDDVKTVTLNRPPCAIA